MSTYEPLRKRVVEAVFTAMDAVEKIEPVGWCDIGGEYYASLGTPTCATSTAANIVVKGTNRPSELVSRSAYSGNNIKAKWYGCVGNTNLSGQWVAFSVASRTDLIFNNRPPDSQYFTAGLIPTVALYTQWQKPTTLYFSAIDGSVDDGDYANFGQTLLEAGKRPTLVGDSERCGNYELGLQAQPDGSTKAFASFSPRLPNRFPPWSFEKFLSKPVGVVRFHAGSYDTAVTFGNLTIDASCDSTNSNAGCYLSIPRDR